jgi:hypothetical protein
VYGERVTGVRVKLRLVTLASGSLVHRGEERTRHGMLTRVARPFAAPSIGFPPRTLYPLRFRPTVRRSSSAVRKTAMPGKCNGGMLKRGR